VTIRLHDTARAAVVPFEPGPVVRMYVCGITPYDSTHLGHAATYIAYDLLVRRLQDLGHEVRMVRNVTDVDDSILPKARQLGIPYLELAESELARFRADTEALNLIAPMAEPRATESIGGMVAMIEQLLADGHAYVAHGTVYFDVATFPRFGEVSGYPRDEMIRLSRERGGNPDDPHRRDPLDFVLWQPSLPDEPAWPAPFGDGRPGWHVECSVMAMSALGPTLDLHGGGTDLIFPHHECEVAQSESVSGVPFVRHWMHSAMVSYDGEKMSKSLGNLVFVSDLRSKADPRAIRLALMRHHYRAGFEWYDTDLDEGNALLRRLLAATASDGATDAAPYAARVRDALDDDLDAPRALEALDDLASAILSSGEASSAAPSRGADAPPSRGADAPPSRGADAPGGAVAALCELAALLGVDLTADPIG
jgi:L-cysteine:1D-myo-inositol 2-amino-2-deoxy-alpha-D-glucopyranoside ligase